MNPNILQRRTSLAIVMAAALLGACAQSQPSPNAPVTAVMGTVDLREPMPLPSNAVLVVELQDTSRADAAAPVISQQSVRLEGLKPPFSYKLPVEPNRLNPAAQYTVTSRITQGNQLIFTNDTVHPVLTRGAGPKADMVLVRVAP